MRFRGFVEATTVVLSAFVLACVFTYPYIVHFTNAGRLDTNDGRWSIWVVAWVAHALTTNPVTVYQANIYYPHQNALAFSEGNLVEGAIAIPAWLLTKNPYTTHNFFFLVCFALSGAATYYLVRYLTGDRRAAAVAGVLFAYCPFVFARQAHSQLLMIGFLPWSMLAFHRLMERTTISRAIELGVVLWLTGLACAYYGIFAGGMVAFGTIMFAITRHHWKEPRYWGAMACAAVVCIGLTLPLFMPYLEMQQRTGFSRTLDDARAYSANAGAWLASSAWAHRWWLTYLQRPYMQDFSEVRMRRLLGWNHRRRLKRVYVWPISRSRFAQDQDRERLLRMVQQYYKLPSRAAAGKKIISAWDTVYIYPDRGLRMRVYSNIPISGRFKADFILLKPAAQRTIPRPPSGSKTPPAPASR